MKERAEMSEKESTLRNRVEEALELVRPQLQADGGGVDLVDVDDAGTVSVRLTGACRGCPMSTMTLRMGIERFLLQQVPEVKRVDAV
jgi:Fe-S cluster biogenesis protein NfuA